MSRLDEALAAVERGWSLIPVRTGDKKAAAPWKAAQSVRATADEIREWFAQEPTINYAVVTGEVSGLAILDIDPKHGGWEAARTLFEAHGGDPHTPIARTPSGGVHVYFRYPGHGLRNSAGTLGDGLDVRAEGGYCVGVGSVVSGAAYTWIHGPGERTVAEFPAWLIEELSRPSAPHQIAVADGLVPEGQRHQHLVSAAGTMKARGMSQEAIEAALVAESKHGIEGEMPESEVLSIAASAAEWGRGGPRGSARGTRPSPIWRPVAEVQPEEVEWLAYPRLPLGKFVLIEGDPGSFKSHITLAWAAAVTTGGQAASTMPGWQASDPANALVLTAEDGLGDTVRPRLDMLGADLTRVHVMVPSTAADFLLDEPGFEQLRAALEQYRPRLVIIDPLVAYVGADMDMHRANEVRAVTKRLAALAEEYGCMIVAVRHLAKSATSKGLYRGMGSIDLTAAARAVLLAGHDPQTDTYALVHMKASLAARAAALTYEHDGEAFRWGEESAITAADLFASDTTSDAGTKLAEAVEWLQETLSLQGPLPELQLRVQAENAGFSRSTLKRAKPSAGVVSKHVKGPDHTWHWEWELKDQGDHGAPPDAAAHGYYEARGPRSPGTEPDPLAPSTWSVEVQSG